MLISLEEIQKDLRDKTSKAQVYVVYLVIFLFAEKCFNRTCQVIQALILTLSEWTL